MKVFLSIDMEGVSGLVRWADVASTGLDYARNRSLLTGDVNAAIAGAYEAGATEVVVEENHGVEDLCNVVMDEVDPRCRVIRGAGRPGATTMAGLDGSIDVVLLVGHHARAGSRPGIMAHTVSYGAFRSVRLAGRPVGETELFLIRAGEVGAPVGLVSGDQIVGQELRNRAPWVEAVEVKRALANQAADCIPPARAQALIRAGATRAVERARAGELPVYKEEPSPYEIEVELREEADDIVRKNIEALPEFAWADARTVVTSAPDMDAGFRRIAYMGFAGLRLGLTRY